MQKAIEVGEGFKFNSDPDAPYEQCGAIRMSFQSYPDDGKFNFTSERELDQSIDNTEDSNNYDGSGNGIFGRKIIYRNHAELAAIIASGSGKIYVKVCIDRKGKATYTEIDNSNTTITNKKTLKNALKMIKGYRYEPDSTAPKEQCGLIKLFLDVNAFR